MRQQQGAQWTRVEFPLEGRAKPGAGLPKRIIGKSGALVVVVVRRRCLSTRECTRAQPACAWACTPLAPNGLEGGVGVCKRSLACTNKWPLAQLASRANLPPWLPFWSSSASNSRPRRLKSRRPAELGLWAGGGFARQVRISRAPHND